MNISCLEELQLKLDLCLSREDRLQLLNDVGQTIESDEWFVVTDDGQCHLFDRDGILDDISKITRLYKSCVKKDIKRICIPDSVTSIEDWMFHNCSNLTSVTIPDSVMSIGDYVFSMCTKLISVIIPRSVMNIGSGAFYKCTSLTSVTIGNSVTNIGSSVFDGCSCLISVIIPDGVTNIGYWAFFCCRSLTSAIIPDSVTNIGNMAFGWCNSLTNITFKGKTLEQVKAMDYFPWGIKDTSIIKVE